MADKSPIETQSVVAACCINSAAMLQIADEPGHSEDKLRRFRELNEKQANMLFEAAVIADEMLSALKAISEFMPVSTASEGGASAHSANVRAADMVRAAIAKAES